MERREIALCIVFTIITCGFYGWYWLVKMTDDCNYASGEQNGTSGGMALLFTIITCGIYGIYWCYKMGEKLETAQNIRNAAADSNMKIIYLVLAIFGLQIIAWALIQNELNKMVAQ